MGIHTITLEQTAKAPKKLLFQLLSDHQNLGRFFDGKYRLIKAGKPEQNGIGAVREVDSGPFTIQEQIIDYKENEHLHYKIIQGVPVNEHGGWIKFTSLNADQSLIHYRIKFSPKFMGTGWILRYLFEVKLKKALSNVAEYSETTWNKQ